MPFDTTNVAATVGQGVAPFDPFATAGKFAALQNALNQNRLFQAQQLGGQAYAASLNPDGTVNQTALAARFRDPRLALVAPEMIQTGQTLASDQQKLAGTQYVAGQNILGAVLPDTTITDPVARRQDQYKRASAALNRAVQSGVLRQDQAAQLVGNGFPGLSIEDAAQQASLVSGNAGEQGQQVGTLQAVNTGPATVYNNVKPAQRIISPIGAVLNAQGPTERGELVTITDPVTGATKAVPRSAIQDAYSNPIPNVPGLTGSHGEITTGVGPQAASNLAGRGTAQAGFEANLQVKAADVPLRKANLDMLDNLAGQFQPGPNSGWWQHMGTLAQEYGIPIGQAKEGEVAASTEFGKIATQVLAAQRAATGLTGTDQQTQLAGMAAPNGQFSRQAIHAVIGTLKGNEDLLNAQYQAWEQAKADPRYANLPFDQFQAKFNRNVNPLVFQAQYASPADREAFAKKVGVAKFRAMAEHLNAMGLLPNGQELIANAQ